MKELGSILKYPCPECGARMKLRNSKYGLFYGCTKFPECKATHGAHKDGEPLGIPANKETKEARIRAHDAFDRLWKPDKSKRGELYLWLAKELGIPSMNCHIGSFDKETCEKVIMLCSY